MLELLADIHGARAFTPFTTTQFIDDPW